MDWPNIYRTAVLAPADPKTVKRFIDGKPVRPSVRVRIMAALLECGLVPPASAPDNAPSGDTSGHVPAATPEPENS